MSYTAAMAMAADYTPCEAAASTVAGVHVLATVASTTRIQIPANWFDKFVTFQAQGLDVFLAFGGSGVTVSLTSVSTVSSEVMTSVATNAYMIPAGQERNFRFQRSAATEGCTHFAHISSGTTGFLRMIETTGENG